MVFSLGPAKSKIKGLSGMFVSDNKHNKIYVAFC